MISIRNPHYPWSVERLVRLCKTWDFHSDLEELDADDGEPCEARACRRVEDAMRAWRAAHPPEHDPLCDDSLASFHVNDVAVLLHECQRLWRLEERVIRALGPPSQRMRFDKKLRKLVPDESDPDD